MDEGRQGRNSESVNRGEKSGDRHAKALDGDEGEHCLMSRANIDPLGAVGESAEKSSPAPKQPSMVTGESESPHDLKATPLRER